MLLQKIRKTQGFTLMELIIVIFIMGILAAIIAPTLITIFIDGDDEPQVITQQQELKTESNKVKKPEVYKKL